MKILIIGAFENPDAIPYPTHVHPVLAEKTDKGYRRLFYDDNGHILPESSQAILTANPEEILPYSEIIRVKSIPHTIGNQTIALKKDKIISSGSKIKITALLLISITPKNYRNVIQSILNTL